MVDEKEFRDRVQQIGRLIAALEQIKDPKPRESARELVQLVMELHGAALEKLMETVFSTEAGPVVVDKLARDPVVSGLLVLHGLHPDDLETRVARAVEQLGPRLRKQDVEVELLSFDQGNVILKAKTNAHACGSTSATLRLTLEDAIYEAAPDVVSLAIEGLEKKNTSGFVPLEHLVESFHPGRENGD